MAQRAATTIGLALGLAFGGPLAAHAQDAAPAAAATPAAGEQDAAEVEEMARQHFQLGRAQYQGGAFREAAESFEQAYALSKREVLWYNIYLAYRDAGNNKQAAAALRNYVERVPEIENRAQLEARLASLDRIVAEEEKRERDEQQRAAEQQQAATAEPTPAPVASTTNEPQQAPVAKKEGTSLVPFVLMGVGGAMVVGGIVTGAMATSKHSELEEKCGSGPCDPSLKSLAEDGKTFALTSDILLFGGLAVAGTGAVLWFLDMNDDGGEQQPVNAAAMCTTHTCAANVSLAF